MNKILAHGAMVLVVLTACSGRTDANRTVFQSIKGENYKAYDENFADDDGDGLDQMTFYQANEWDLFWPEQVNGKDAPELRVALAEKLTPISYEGDDFEPQAVAKSLDELLQRFKDYIDAEGAANIRLASKQAVTAAHDMSVSSMNAKLRMKSCDNDVFVFATSVYMYPRGAAHGGVTMGYVSYDSKLDKVLALTDIVTDTVVLRKVLTEAQLEEKEVDNMNDLAEKTGYFISHEAMMPLAGEFYYDGYALHMVYQQYEIASYADGIIDLEVPMYKLLDAGILTPYAKEQE